MLKRLGPEASLKTALSLSLLFMAAEVVGGIVSHSLALLADAGHMLSDAASLALALLAARLSQKRPDFRFTFGYSRAEVLAAMVNASALLAVGLIVLFEAFRRILFPPPVNGQLVLLVAVPGLGVNLAMVWILHRDRKSNLNLRAAFLHVLADTLGSLQVIAAGTLITFFNWTWADPGASLIIGVLILFSGWRVIREATVVLMEGAPHGLDPREVAGKILGVRGVVGVHDLHVWVIASNFVAASFHLEVTAEAGENVLWEIRNLLEREFGIHHTTIQVEKVASGAKSTLPTLPQTRTKGSW